MSKRMRPQWIKFANKYIETNNIYESAIYAGYSESYARGRAYELLEKECIKEYIQERIKDQEAQGIADVDEILKFYSSVMRGEVKDQLGFETSVKDRISAAKELEKRYPAKEDLGEIKKLDKILEGLDAQAAEENGDNHANDR